MNWSDLSMSQRSELMSIYLKNGIASLDEMKKHYNSFAEGGNIDDPPTNINVTTPLFSIQGTLPEDSSLEDRYKANDIAKGIEYAGNYFGSEGFKNRAIKANQKYGYNLYNLDDPLRIQHFPKRINFIQNNSNANAAFNFGLSLYENPIFAGGHETGHHIPLYNTHTFGLSDDIKAQMANPNSTLYSPRYHNNYSQIPEEWRNILRPINPEDDHNAELSEAYSDLVGLRAVLKDYGIFDSDDPNAVFTQEMLDEFKKQLGSRTNRFLDYHSDENVIRAVNEIADAGQSSIGNYAAKGGKLDIPPFAKRYNEGQRRAIPTSQGNATHYMAVDSYNGKHYVYPTVQPIDYNDTNSPLKYYGDRAFDRALENNDVMEFNLLDDAIRYSENYKRPPSTGAYLNNDNTPAYSPYDYVRSFAKGGLTGIPPERFFGIATPEVTDNTVYQPTYGTILPEVSVTPRGPIKELAHTINLYGNTVKYPKPRMMNFDEFKSRQQRTYKIYHPDSSEEAPYIYHQKYGKKYPFFPNQEEAKRMKYIKDSLYSNDYEKYKQREFTRVNNSGSTPSQNAASLSLVGSWLSLFPWAPTKVIGTIAQVPDLVLDAAAAIDNPKASTIGHNVIDYAPYIAKLIPGKYDDYILKGLNLIGNTDDAMSSKGTDLLENLDKSESEETFSRGGSIHIKPENRGKFTALKKRTGHSASWFKENGTPAQKKMAVFALNAKKWRK